MEDYEINSRTLALISIDKTSTHVIEDESDFIVKHTPTEIIDHSCRYFGSSYEGRHVGTMEILGIQYKTPILIEETNNIIFFPTASCRSTNCCWISLDKIEKYMQDSNYSKVIFKNGNEIKLNISLGSLENQIFRATRLDSILRKRRKIG
jgi:competence protein ComK